MSTDATMQSFESINDARRLATQILDGEVDPNLGCGLIAGIGEKLNHPDALSMFLMLCHEQHGHEGLGITPESCIPDILTACRELLATQTE